MPQNQGETVWVSLRNSFVHFANKERPSKNSQRSRSLSPSGSMETSVNQEISVNQEATRRRNMGSRERKKRQRQAQSSASTEAMGPEMYIATPPASDTESLETFHRMQFATLTASQASGDEPTVTTGLATEFETSLPTLPTNRDDEEESFTLLGSGHSADATGLPTEVETPILPLPTNRDDEEESFTLLGSGHSLDAQSTDSEASNDEAEQNLINVRGGGAKASRNCCAQTDWHGSHIDKLLEQNAQALRANNRFVNFLVAGVVITIILVASIVYMWRDYALLFDLRHKYSTCQTLLSDEEQKTDDLNARHATCQTLLSDEKQKTDDLNARHATCQGLLSDEENKTADLGARLAQTEDRVTARDLGLFYAQIKMQQAIQELATRADEADSEAKQKRQWLYEALRSADRLDYLKWKSERKDVEISKLKEALLAAMEKLGEESPQWTMIKCGLCALGFGVMMKSLNCGVGCGSSFA